MQIYKYRKKVLELKIAITEMKNSLEGLKGGFEQAAKITVNLKKKNNLTYQLWETQNQQSEEVNRAQGTCGTYQEDQHKHCESLISRRERKGQRDYWRSNGQTLPEYDAISKSTNPRSLMNCKYDKLKETLQETHYNRTVKRQRDNLEDSRDN